MTLNKNRHLIQTHHSTLWLLFCVECFYIAVLHFSKCKKLIGLEEQHSYLSISKLIVALNYVKYYWITAFNLISSVIIKNYLVLNYQSHFYNNLIKLL